MRIACPNCSAEYDVPDSLLATGPRLLRCARCKTQFEAAMPGAAPPAPVVAAPPPEPEALPEPPPAPPPEPSPAAAERPPEPPAPLPGRPEPGAATLEVESPPLSERDRPKPTRGPARHSPIEPPPPHRLPEPEPPRAAGGVVLAWLLSFALIAAAGWATYTFHAEITAAWPPAARLYQALGIN